MTTPRDRIDIISAHEVTFQMFRGHPWPTKYCAKCQKIVPNFHKHWGRADRPAMPQIGGRTLVS